MPNSSIDLPAGPRVAISDLVIEKRQRQTMTENQIKDLAESIARYGLLQSPVLTRLADGRLQLVSGFTRLQALMFLGVKEIPYRLKEEVDPIILKELELEENIRRTDLEWWERSEAIAEIHELKQANDPEWSMRKTAELTGTALGKVSQSVQLREEIKRDPTIKQEKTLAGALKKFDAKKRIAKKKEEIAARARGRIAGLRAEILPGDAAELIKKEPDQHFDAVITNLPFGVDLEFKSGHAPYHDDEEYITRLVQTIVHESFRILKDDSWFVAWFDVRKITYSNAHRKLFRALMNSSASDEIKRLAFDSMGLAFWLEDAGFSYVNVVPAFWVKPNKTQGIIGDPRKGMIIAAEAMLIASKGNAILMKQGRNNVFIYDTLTSGERDYSMQMPPDLCTEIVSMVALGGSRILDPFAGSGSIGLGALNRQCEFRGYEINPEIADLGNALLKSHHLSMKDQTNDTVPVGDGDHGMEEE